MSYEKRKIYCPTCRGEVDGYNVQHGYKNKVTGQVAAWKEAHMWPANQRVSFPKCKEGHEAYYVSMTTKECPVCHTVGMQGYNTKVGSFDEKTGRPYGQWRERPENEPCVSCTDEIESLRRFQVETVKATESLEAWTVLKNPCFYIDGVTVHDPYKLEYALRDLCCAIGRPAIEEKSIGMMPTQPEQPGIRNESYGKYLYAAGVAEKVQNLYEAIRHCIGLTAKNNLEKGRSLILQLAEGKITGGDFENGKLRYSND